MTRSTTRSGLSRAAAVFLAAAFATGWTRSGPVLASSAVEVGRPSTSAPSVANVGSEAVAAPLAGSPWLAALHEHRENAWAARAASARPAAPEAKPAAAKPAAAKPKVHAAEPKAPAPKAAATRPTYSGTNRFWIPSLGMSDPVHWFSCTRSRDPDNYIYRWGCAGANNVYILGHAYGVMKPLHDLYVRGGLRKGMVAIYADGNGRVHWYRVVSWQVVDPTQVTWAIASQPVPSMTLQTCVGKDSQYRLNVRLVQYKVT
jgi:hypothetical protein